MDIKQKKSILTHLAQKAGSDPIAQKAIQKEFAKITASLQSEIQYEKIADQIELLDTIAYRVHEKAVGAIKVLLERLKGLVLTYEKIPGYPAERLNKYKNNFSLMVNAIKVLENIRYHQIFEILDILFEYSCHTEESVIKEAKNGIEKLAGYDLNIFYGDGKNWHGLGSAPQEKVLEKIASFNETKKQKYFSAIIVVCKQILSPIISGTSSTYKTVIWRTGALPAIDGVKQIRKKALYELQNLYALAKNLGQKKAVLNAMETATHIPHTDEYGHDVLAMIIENSIIVIEFMKGVALSSEIQVMQKIEHDAYWLIYQMGRLDETVHKVALEIRDALYADKEYQIFRILIGFESIFHDWEKRREEIEDFEREGKFREAEALKLAENINADSYNEWKERIIRYASIKSNDMATFLYFMKFLEHFGKTSPALALQLLLETLDYLENFIISILCGVAETERQGDVFSLIEDWCNEGKYLFSLARFFEYSPQVNEALLKKILNKAVANNDLNTLNQIISSISARYNEENKHLIKSFFVPILEKLTVHKNSGWIFGFWFRKQRSAILDDMEVAEHKAILDNLFWLEEVDYHAEEILYEIAKKSPELVIQFFCNRLSREKDEEDKGRYNAIPFNFYKLAEPLSQHPVQAIDAVLNIYDDNYGLFIYNGARLLKNIFPNFPAEFQQKLLEIVQSKEERDLLFVMAILRNYDGNLIIQNVCKEIVKILPYGSNLTNELSIILQSTGIVTGEYGLVEIYKQKINEIQPWLRDKSVKVKEFAQNYIAALEKSIEYEKKLADEDIILRKHKYGAGED
ncbi:MAG: hypothetical protein JW787_14630 [Sedimentisphaerales bacterium]|nr:hypothetical protein [Sedimentisphaerales bacterium]